MREPTDPLHSNPRVPRKRRDETWLKEIVLASACVAMALHFLGIFTVKNLGNWGIPLFQESKTSVPSPIEAKPGEVIETRILSDSLFQKMVVDSKKAKIAERNANETSRFLGAQTQRVENETRSEKFGDPNAVGNKDILGAEAELAESTQAKETRAEKVARQLGLGSSDNKNTLNLEQGTGRLDTATNSERARGTRDRLPKDIAIGADTILNTDEYVFASFFNRIKAEVGPRWDPMVQQILRDPHNRIPEGVYLTQTQFVCDRAGNIESVDVLRRSGMSVFDDAAERAILQTRRVANPPQALLELDGRFRIKLGFEVSVRAGGIQTEYIPDPRFQKIPGL